MELTETSKREKAFHEKRYKKNKGRRGLVTNSYIACKFADERHQLLTDVKESRVLEIGCSIGISKAKYFKYKLSNVKKIIDKLKR